MRALRALRRLLPAALILAGGSGCAGALARDPFVQPGAATSEIQVYIENRGFTDLRVYARSSHGQQYLGQVAANAHLTASLPWRQLDQVSFKIEVVAGRTYTTGSVAVAAGQRVEIFVPDDPSKAVVRRG